LANELEFIVEAIPDKDDVYMRAHRAYFRDGELGMGVFRSQGGGMSVDWSRYSTPQDTRNRAKSPEANAVILMNVGEIRNIQYLLVKHVPLPVNRAHSNVSLPSEQERLTEARTLLLRVATVALLLVEPTPATHS
jgi:hypothetical protein